MTKRYTSLAFEYDPSGDWVKHADYLALQSALREALDQWEYWLGQDLMTIDPRISELRKLLES